MATRRVTVTEFTCDGCGRTQRGTITDDVFGIVGKATEHTPGGGHGTEWFACSRPCIAAAVGNALDLALEQ